MKHFIIVPDGGLQKIAGALVESRRILRIFLVQNALGFFLVGAIAENNGHPQLAPRVRCHLSLEFLIIQLGHRHRGHRKNGIKAAQTLLLLDFFHRASGGRSHLSNIDEGVELVRLIPPIGLLIKMLQNILGHQSNALRRQHGLFAVDVPYHFIGDFLFRVHGLDVIHPKGQYILVVNGIHNGIGMQLVPKGLSRRKELRVLGAAGIRRKNRRPCKAEEMILLEVLHNSRVHIAKLTAVAFVKDNHHLLGIHRMAAVFFYERGQLLNGGNNNHSLGIFQLFFQNGCRGVAVGGPFFKAVVFLHGLVIEILAVYHKEHLFDIGKLGGQPGRLEGSQRFAGAGGMPNIAAPGDAAVFLVVVGDVNAV